MENGYSRKVCFIIEEADKKALTLTEVYNDIKELLSNKYEVKVFGQTQVGIEDILYIRKR